MRRAALCLGLLAVAGCGGDPSEPAAPADRAQDDMVEIRTTDPQIADANLDFSVTQAQRLVDARPADPQAVRQLAELLITRVQFRNSFDDFDTALANTSDLVRRSDGAAAARLVLARVLTAVHRFGEACDQLSLVKDSALREEVVARSQAIALATGKAADVLDEAGAAVQQQPSYETLTRLAAVLGETGQLDEADRRYRQALEQYPGTSPFAVAWIHYQRGRLWAETDDVRARPHFVRALVHLPGYVSAGVQLAELDARQGDTEAAIERLAEIAAHSSDPDIRSVWASLLLARGAQSEAEPLIAEARGGFEDLLRRHRAAFADHAAEFYAGPGRQPDLAQRLRDEIRRGKAVACTAR